MNFLLDQDVYAATGRYLSQLGHDVVRVAEIGMAQASDANLLQVAHGQDRIFVTCDRDFGSLVFLQGMGAGVLYLRMLPSTQNAVHAELRRVLESYSEEDLVRAFVVVEPDGHRIRRFPAEGQEAQN